jgi:hypothetical protein
VEQKKRESDGVEREREKENVSYCWNQGRQIVLFICGDRETTDGHI